MSSDYIKVLKLQRSQRRLTEVHEIVRRNVVAQQLRASYLREFIRQEPDLPTDLAAEVVAELQDEEELLPSQSGERVPDMAAIAREIGEVYGQIRQMITERGEDPGLADAVRPLREKLRSLEREEAEGIELHVRSQLLFDPREASSLLDRAEKLLKDR
ncbi:MAG TPA: hypothetical protein VGK45_02235 [Thermoanaerobaculia bacterium]